MTRFNQFLIILAIFSSISSSHSRPKIRKIPRNLHRHHLIEESASAENEESNEAEKNEKVEICKTIECRQLAKAFSETLDKSVDPCVDFYEFSCGGWEAKKPIPKYEHSWDRYKHFESIVEDRIREELEAEPKSKEILPVQKARKWYRSCMDFETREARGIKPIDSIMMQIGGWPMIMDTNEWSDEISWQKVENHYLRMTGKHTFSDIKLMSLPNEPGIPTGGILEINTPELPLNDILPLEYRNYTGDDLKSYRLLIEGTARLFIEESQADVTEEQLNQDIDDLIEFEKKIYTTITDPDSLIQPEKKIDEGLFYYEGGLDDFLEWWNDQIEKIEDEKYKIDWRDIIQQLFDLGNAEINDRTPIEFGHAKSYFIIQEILHSTHKRTIVNYIHWKFVSKALKYTIDEVKDVFNEIVKDEYGVQERPPRWRECVREIEMTDAVSFIFVEKYFRKNTAEAADKMTENVRMALEKEIRNSNWMSSDAKEAAVEKIRKMKALIGFPDWYNNRTAIVNHYKGLIIGPDYLDNILSFMRYSRRTEIQNFVGYKKNAKWEMDPITVNAVYLLGSNILSIYLKIVWKVRKWTKMDIPVQGSVPAVNFQSPLFGSEVPDYVNYGIAGSTIGHEMGHGFDPDGINFGLRPAPQLLENDMMKMYYQHSSCFVKQYDRYYDAQKTTPKSDRLPESNNEQSSMSFGALTAGENIADLTGVQTIFDAYINIRNKEKPNGELKLPGFEDFTDEKMFFISYAAQWCEVFTNDFKERKNKTPDTHSPSRLRVIGPISNTIDFARVFNCSKNTPMNPENKCDIWREPGAAKILESSRRWKHHRHYLW